MKKKYTWMGILFLLLTLCLIAGISFLTLYNNPIEHVEKETEQVMSIALVNEDEGAHFNGKRIVFGDEFSNRIHKDTKHEWYVVSRGVAESGYNRGSYDMIITIPNDFSAKSLSIHLDNPQPVALQYKINATGHENVRAEAEKTAGRILNDFNRRLIDVYFASIIGMLHEAQDNIGEIIEKEKTYTGLYQQHIYSPLADYTNQFQTVRDYTEISKESYQGLEDVLSSFQLTLNEDVDNNKSFGTEIDSIIQTKDSGSELVKSFSDYVNQFIEQMNRQDILTALSTLEKENERVHREFQSIEEQWTIVSRAKAIEARFSRMEKELINFIDELENTIDTEVSKVVKDKIQHNFDESIEPAIEELFSMLDDKMVNEIKNQINKLPSIEKDDIINSSIEGDSLRDLTNIIDVTNKFNEEFDHQYHKTTDSQLLSEKIKAIKRNLVWPGVYIKDEINIAKAGEMTISLDVPDHFSIRKFKLTFADGDTTEGPYRGPVTLNVPEGRLALEVHVVLRNANAPIDVFAPIEWTWNVSHESEEIIEGESETNEQIESEEIVEEVSDNHGAERNRESEESSEHKAILDGEDIEDDNENAPISSKETVIATETIVSETIIKTNHQYKQKVQSALTEEPKEELLDAAVEMVNEYYKLYAILELYFGIDIQDENLPEKLQEPFDDIAADTSLYTIFHEKDIKLYFEEQILENLQQSITEDIQNMLMDLSNQINEYQSFLEQSSARSKQLVEEIEETKKHADALNDELKNVLNELANWRDESRKLLEEKGTVLEHDSEMGTALLSLSTNFQPIVLSSESIAEQAKNNFDRANQVYDTFDAIDQQAVQIIESGSNIVLEARDLANKWSEKVLEDDKFKENFADVLPNSRIGDRPNENLFRFLSNPVQTKNTGIITEQDSFVAYFIVLIISIVTLFTSYVISTLDIRRKNEAIFEERPSIIQLNRNVMWIIAVIGLLEGIIIAVLSYNLLQLPFEHIYIWIVLVTLITIILLTFATYLLRQLKMVGMFILLVIFSLYLLLTKSLGFKFQHSEVASMLRHLSPLQQIETVIGNLIEQGVFPSFIVMVAVIALALLGVLMNLFVYENGMRRKGNENDHQAEAN